MVRVREKVKVRVCPPPTLNAPLDPPISVVVKCAQKRVFTPLLTLFLVTV